MVVKGQLYALVQEKDKIDGPPDLLSYNPEAEEWSETGLELAADLLEGFSGFYNIRHHVMSYINHNKILCCDLCSWICCNKNRKKSECESII